MLVESGTATIIFVLWFKLLSPPSLHTEFLAKALDFFIFVLFGFVGEGDGLRRFAEGSVKDLRGCRKANGFGSGGVHQGLENQNSVTSCSVELSGFESAGDALNVEGREVLAGVGGGKVSLDLADRTVDGARDLVEGKAGGQECGSWWGSEVEDGGGKCVAASVGSAG